MKVTVFNDEILWEHYKNSSVSNHMKEYLKQQSPGKDDEVYLKAGYQLVRERCLLKYQTLVLAFCIGLFIFMIYKKILRKVDLHA